MKNIVKIISLALFLSLVIPQAALATAVFDRNYLLSDYNLTNANATTSARIQSFLSEKGGLGAVKAAVPSGGTKSAAQIIYEAGVYYRINPQYLIVRLQIEQSLITTASPTQRQLDWATGYGVCDNCSKDDPAVRKYMGFFNQVNWAARILTTTELNQYGNPRGYLPSIAKLGYTLSGWGPGITKKTGDGYAVTPANSATAALYTYTPYVYNANYNFWTMWNRWFTKHYPDGSLLRVGGEPGVYLIQNGKKRGFNSFAALASRFDPAHIIVVSRSEIDAYEDGPRITFANYSLVQSQTTKKIYLIDGDQLRLIISQEVFRAIGFNPEEVISVTDSSLADYETGPNITMSDNYPTGILLQSRTTGGVSYVQDGIRHSIMSPEILRDRFPNQKPIPTDDTTIIKYPKGAPILFKDGNLVTSPSLQGGIYVISNGQRRPINSRQTFEAFGFRWENIITTSDAAVFIHPKGNPIDVYQE
jgi:hypothetical protein